MKEKDQSGRKITNDRDEIVGVEVDGKNLTSDEAENVEQDVDINTNKKIIGKKPIILIAVIIILFTITASVATLYFPQNHPKDLVGGDFLTDESSIINNEVPLFDDDNIETSSLDEKLIVDALCRSSGSDYWVSDYQQIEQYNYLVCNGGGGRLVSWPIDSNDPVKDSVVLYDSAQCEACPYSGGDPGPFLERCGKQYCFHPYSGTKAYFDVAILDPHSNKLGDHWFTGGVITVNDLGIIAAPIGNYSTNDGSVVYNAVLGSSIYDAQGAIVKQLVTKDQTPDGTRLVIYDEDAQKLFFIGNTLFEYDFTTDDFMQLLNLKEIWVKEFAFPANQNLANDLCRGCSGGSIFFLDNKLCISNRFGSLSVDLNETSETTYTKTCEGWDTIYSFSPSPHERLMEYLQSHDFF